MVLTNRKEKEITENPFHNGSAMPRPNHVWAEMQSGGSAFISAEPPFFSVK